MQFLFIALIWMLVTAALLFLAVGLKQTEGKSAVKVEGLMIAYRLERAVDSFSRNLCYDAGCESRVVLPGTIRTRDSAAEVNYSVALSANSIVVSPEGFENITIYTPKGIGGFNVTVEETNDSKIVILRG